MTQPERTLVRDRERTRRMILEAAEQAIEQQGAGVSLAEIATLAGVTKSGLLHHFRTRDILIEAVFEHTVMRTWEEVRAQIDITENRPGKFTRAYVRAFTGDSEYLTHAASPTGLYAVLGTHIATASHNAAQAADAQAWTAAFEADGLPIGRALAIRYAAEGLVAAMNCAYLTADHLARVREELLALTETHDDSVQ
ncbi:TetR/AcrR family transcriptional regulator [Aeromicrobium wangtongii]|uniref:TetR/AcrR family transcriptional regulator n=1 Tax=Aeromicrobium wangtongii TaxID=2969247 RepID=A0ABY5ME10_9ACTN|nr:TetR family transcriptional regulator [Aeromicrobium wangtongii]MCD9197903.1 TetR/AcrR family transcriptional regulator [Aeromicrobium wangtongii]UUP15381.1 TetR/AcrR family transcriptional regulator [Aeromicrobium wangtongii]